MIWTLVGESVEARASASSIASDGASTTSASTQGLAYACLPFDAVYVRCILDELLQTGIQDCAIHEIFSELHIEQLGVRERTCSVCGGGGEAVVVR